MKKFHFRKCVIILGIGLAFSSAQSQSLKFQNLPKDKSQYEVRFLRPNFDSDVELSTFSGLYDVTMNIPATSKLNVVCSIPYGFFSAYGESEEGFGNLYIGIQTRNSLEDNKGSSYAAGVFLPTSPDDNYSLQLLGRFTNYYEIQKYIPNTLTVYGNYSYCEEGAEGTLFGFEVGPNVWIPTEGHGRETEVILHYGIKAGIGMNRVTLLLELTGMAILTEDVDTFDERTTHSLAVGARLNCDKIVPSIFYEVYLDDDLGDYVDNILGFKLEKALN